MMMMSCWVTGGIHEMKHCTNLYMGGPKPRIDHEECKQVMVVLLDDPDSVKWAQKLLDPYTGIDVR